MYSREKNKAFLRIKVFKLFVLITFFILFYKAVNYQVFFAGKRYVEMGNKSFIRIKKLPAKRGEIYDRNLIPLALSIWDGSEFKRVYTFGWITSNLIGFVGVEGKGLEGIEFQFDEVLRGKDGKGFYFRTPDGEYFLLPEKEILLPEHGNDLILTIDVRFQDICSRILKKYGDNYRATGGWVIIVDVKTGEILASSSYPFFEPEKYYLYDYNTYRHYPFQFSFEPGSVFKLLTLGCAIENTGVKLNTVFDVSRPLVIEKDTINDPEVGIKKRKKITFEEIAIYSSNIGVSKVALKINSSLLFKYAVNSGFGTRTGILFPAENPGLIRNYKSWKKIDKVTFSFGQGLNVSPLQIALFYSAIGNNGILLHPVLIKGIAKENEFVSFDSKIKVRRIFDNRTCDILKNILKKVIEKGSGKRANIKGIEIMGKTGTAEKWDPVKKRYSQDKFVMSFVGIVKIDTFNIVVYTGLDEPKKGRFASDVVVPMFREIVEELIDVISPIRYYES
jgi:cell division protein FtsI (penicillin-binding protein 3)